MIGRHDQRRVGIVDEGVGDRAESFVTRRELVHAPLLVELFDRGADVAARQGLHDLFQRRVLLPDDGVKADRVDAGLLQLVIRSAGLHRLVLARIPDQKDAIVGRRACGGSRASVSYLPGSIHPPRRAADDGQSCRSRGRDDAVRSATGCRPRQVGAPREMSGRGLRRGSRPAPRRRGWPPGLWSCQPLRRLRARRDGRGWRGSARQRSAVAH